RASRGASKLRFETCAVDASDRSEPEPPATINPFPSVPSGLAPQHLVGYNRTSTKSGIFPLTPDSHSAYKHKSKANSAGKAKKAGTASLELAV
ncbi:MAG: hypothetical protein ACRD21_20720, partial [Vicinamibacteria bacterium]